MNHLINVLILSSFFLIAFAIGEVAYRFFKVNGEYTRKWGHISSGFLALLFPFMINDPKWVAFICLLFALLLKFSKPLGWLPSINAVDRKTFGSVLFPAAVLLSYLAYDLNDKQLVYYFLPVLTLAVSDLAAALIGKRFPLMPIKVFDETKSLGGYLAFTVTCFLIMLYFYLKGDHISLLSMMLIPPMAALAELFSPKGFDNISIPLAVIGGLIWLN